MGCLNDRMINCKARRQNGGKWPPPGWMLSRLRKTSWSLVQVPSGTFKMSHYRDTDIGALGTDVFIDVFRDMRKRSHLGTTVHSKASIIF